MFDQPCNAIGADTFHIGRQIAQRLPVYHHKIHSRGSFSQEVNGALTKLTPAQHPDSFIR
ncbi:hypothetical protein JCM39068_18990 [Desulfocastanea catecholica]